MKFPVPCGLAAVALLFGSPALASDVSDCRLAIAEASNAFVRAYQASINDCLKFGNYSDCTIGSRELEQAGDALGKAVDEDSSSCAAALDGGSTIDQLWPAECSGDPFFSSYRRYGDLCSQPVTDLNSLGQCVYCQFIRVARRLQFALDVPRIEPESPNDRKCIRAVTSAYGKAIRLALRQANRCAADSGEPPWSCTLDLSADSKLSKALAGIDRKVAKCRDEAGAVGRIGRGSRELCNTALATTGELTSCLRQAATCEACLGMSVALAESLDCAAVSGDSDCRLDAVKPEEGSFVVANRDDATVSIFDHDGAPALDTLAASTFAVGASPIDVIFSEKTNSVFTVSSTNETVTGIEAGTGAPIHGSLGASSVGVGAAPVALAVHGELDLLYVANSGDNTVTFLDAADLSYAFGTEAASTFQVGSEPSALALKHDGSVLYVANAGSGTVTYLDAATGQPLLGTLATSTFAVGPEPRGLWATGPSGPYDVLAVADSGDGRLRFLDLESGAAVPIGSEPDVVLGGEPIALAGGGYGRFYSASATGTDVGTWSASRGTEPTMAGGRASDVAIGVTYDEYNRPEPGTVLLVTLPDSDEVVLSTTTNGLSNAGVSPAENSTIPNDHEFRNWIYSSGQDEYYATTCQNYPTGQVGVINGATLATEQLFDFPTCLGNVAYGPSGDDLYVTAGDDVIFLDAATGAGRFGSIASSTFSCGCDLGGLQQVIVNETDNRLYLQCTYYVAYMDATTGACLGGSRATTGFPENVFIGDMFHDEATGTLFMTPDCEYNYDHRTVYLLDSVVPQFLTGSADSSKLPGAPEVCGTEVFQGTGDGTLYVFGGGYLRNVDAATGNVVSSLGPYLSFESFEADAEHDILRMAYDNWSHDFLAFRNLSDYEFVTGDADTSILSTVDYYSSPTIVPSPGSDYSLIVGTNWITRIRRDSMEFSNHVRTLGGTVVATGDHPSAVASMPALTGY
jgi:DNA-binding beta-propeller fold protein YncE